MTRGISPIVLLLLAAALLLPATAQAQMQPSLTIALEPPEEPLAPGGRAVYHGTATFTADASAMAELTGVKIHYSIVDAPAWASVMVSPSEQVFLFWSPGASVTSQVRFEIVVDASDTATDLTGALAIQGATVGHPTHRPAVATGAMPLVVKGALPECTDGDSLTALAADAPRLTVPAAGGALPLAAAVAAAVAVAVNRRGRAFSPLAGAVLFAAALGGFALTAAPVADAQSVSNPTLLLEAAQPTDPTPAGGSLTVPLAATYIRDATASTELAGTPVAFMIRDKPSWASVVLSPSNAVFHPNPQLSLVMVDEVQTIATIHLAKDAPPGAVAAIFLDAVTAGGMTQSPAHAGAVIALKVAGASCGATAEPPANETVAAGDARR